MKQISRDFYDFAPSNKFSLNNLEYIAEKLESPTQISRRGFLAGLGAVGAAITGLSGCGLFLIPAEHRVPYDFNAHKKYDSGPILVNKLEDFLLSGEELAGMKLAVWGERKGFGRLTGLKNPNTFLSSESNPFIENPSRRKGGYCIGYSTIENKEVPICEKSLLADYIGITDYPLYSFAVAVSEFDSPKKALIVAEEYPSVLRETHIKFKTNASLYTKDKYLCVIVTALGLNPNVPEPENSSRLQLYQKKRGLKLHWKSD